jgi:hypothetical protein
MTPLLRRSPLLAALACLVPLTARAQTAPADALPPPPPAGGVALSCPSCEPSADDRRAIDEATELLAAGRADAARRVLSPRLTGQSPWGPSYGPLAVLDRLATRLADRPAAPADAAATADETQQPRGGVEAVSLYASAITLGLGTGAWLDVMFEVDDVRAAVAMPLVLGAAGAGALYLAERNAGPIRRGRGTAMSNGFVLGITAGTLLGVYGGNELRWSGRGVATTIWAGAALGTGLGLAVGALAESRPASASFVGSGGLWGALFGLTAAGLVNADDDGVPIAGMVGELVGAGAAAALAGSLRPTEAQVRWMDLGVFSGGLVGVGLAVLLFADASGRSLTGPALVVEAGMIGGGALGYVLGRPSPAAPARSAAARDRFAMSPSIGPTAGGAQVLLSLPNLL